MTFRIEGRTCAYTCAQFHNLFNERYGPTMVCTRWTWNEGIIAAEFDFSVERGQARCLYDIQAGSSTYNVEKLTGLALEQAVTYVGNLCIPFGITHVCFKDLPKDNELELVMDNPFCYGMVYKQ